MADAPYLLDELRVSAFRAFLKPQTFDFAGKGSLAVFAPNGSGKSSIVDALEFVFSKEGTLERLGVRAIHNQAGVAALAHNLAEDRGIRPEVRVSFKRGKEKSDGVREARGSLRTRPAIADAVTECFTVDPLIRGHALRRFVEKETAEERYEAVARWLELEPLVAVQRNLRALRQRVKAAAESCDVLDQVNVQFRKHSTNEVDESDEDRVLAYANSMLEPLDSALVLRSLDCTDAAFVAASERANAEELQLGLPGLRQLRRTAAALYCEHVDPVTGDAGCTGRIPDFELAVDEMLEADEDEAAEHREAANAVFEDLWKAAEELFAEGSPILETCPVCATPIAGSAAGSMEGIREHLAAHRAELAAYTKARQRSEDASEAAGQRHGELLASLETLLPLLADEHAALQVALREYADAAKRWSNRAAPDGAELKTPLSDLTSAMDAGIEAVEGRQAENTYVKACGKLKEIIDLRNEREWSCPALTDTFLTLPEPL